MAEKESEEKKAQSGSMKGTNLLSRLARYSQNPRKLSIENFTTEMVAHLFNHDLIFRRRFLEAIFDNQRMARSFKQAVATTQQPLGLGCYVDLVLRVGGRKHLIEVKIGAGETRSGRRGQTGKPQIQRYVDLGVGHVTYLTTSDSLTPEVDFRGRRFHIVKHAFFEELHTLLDASRTSDMTKLFLAFMEENGMAKPRPFDRKELKSAEDALKLSKKCKSTLAIVRAESNEHFRRNIGTRANLTKPELSFGPDWEYVHCYLRIPRKKAVRYVGLTLYAENGRVYFCVWLWGNLHPSIAKIRKYLRWEEDEERGCYKSICLHGNRNDIARMIRLSESGSKALGRAIRRFA